MRIELIQFCNFRGLRGLAIEMPDDKPLILTGPNGSGKSSVIHGLQWLLNGENPTDQTRFDGLLHTGAKDGFVTAETEEGTITRHIKPHRITVPGLAKAKLDEAQLEICNIARCRARHIGLTLRPDLFLALKGDKQRELLFDLLRIRFGKKVVEEHLIDAGLIDAYRKHGGPNDFADINGAYSNFFAARTVANRTLKEAEARLKADEVGQKNQTTAYPPDPAELEQVKARIEAANRLIGANEQREQRIKKLRLAIATCPSSSENMTTKLATMEAAVNRLEYDFDRATYTSTVEHLKRLERLNVDACPSCNRPWEDADARAAERSRLAAEIAELETNNQRYMTLKQELLTSRRELDAFRKIVSSSESKIRMEQDLRALAAENPTPIDYDALEAARDKLKRLEDQRVWAAEWTQWQSGYAANKRRVEKLRKEAQELEDLVAFFGPNGLKLRIFAAKCKPVEEQLNATLGLWGIELRISDVMELEFHRGQGTWRTVASGSHGERTLIALALQVWLATFTGLRIIVMDDLEALDQENFNLLVSACEDLLQAGEVDHIILAGVGLQGVCSYATEIGELTNAV